MSRSQSGWTHDPLTQITRDVERQVGFFRDRVNKVRRQLRSSDPDVVTISTLRGACVTLAKGINGIQYGARPVPLEPELLGNVREAAISWFTAVAEVIGPAIQDRDHKLAAAPAVLAAIGAIGNPLVRSTTLKLGTLEQCNWPIHLRELVGSAVNAGKASRESSPPKERSPSEERKKRHTLFTPRSRIQPT